VTFGKKNHEGIKMRLRFTRLISNGSFPGANSGPNVTLYSLYNGAYTPMDLMALSI